MTEQELEELEGALREASPAPWLVDPAACGLFIWEPVLDGRSARHVATMSTIEDADLVAALRNAAPSLISEVRRLRAAIRWALGEDGTFPERGYGDGAYWWRKELRARVEHKTAREAK